MAGMRKSDVWAKATEMRKEAERLEEYLNDTDDEDIDVGNIQVYITEMEDHLNELQKLTDDLNTSDEPEDE